MGTKEIIGYGLLGAAFSLAVWFSGFFTGRAYEIDKQIQSHISEMNQQRKIIAPQFNPVSDPEDSQNLHAL